jgi:hypothetical protein
LSSRKCSYLKIFSNQTIFRLVSPPLQPKHKEKIVVGIWQCPLVTGNQLSQAGINED